MRFCGAGVLWLFTACGLSIAVVHLGAQGLSAPNASSVGPHSVGPQAVKVILKHFAINQLASDPNTHQPLRVDDRLRVAG